MRQEKIRLLDRIVAGQFEVLENSYAIRRSTLATVKKKTADHITRMTPLWASQAQMLVADNVAEYVFGSVAPDKGELCIKDLPCLRPPFDQMWIETMPHKNYHAVGVGLIYYPVAEAQDVLEKIPTLCLPNLHGVLFGEIYASPFKGGLGHFCTFQIPLDEQGRVLSDFLHTQTVVGDLDERQEEDFMITLTALAYPALLAVSFCHCKNITTIEAGPSDKLVRAHKKRTDKDLLRYRLLAIEPMRQGVRRVKTDQTEEAKLLDLMGLHIRRGHFKTFDEKPLFGRHKGTYWWPMLARGNPENGIIDKDYAIKM